MLIAFYDWLVRQKAAAGKRGQQERLDLHAHLRVGVAGPGHVRLDREARAQASAANVRHDDACLARDQLRAEVVWVAADAGHKAARAKVSEKQRAQVCREAVVAAGQLVKLPGARSVLVFEAVGLARHHRPQRAEADLLVNRRQLVARAREEARDLRVAVRDGRRLRWAETEGRALARQAVEARGPRALAPYGPGNVGKVLLEERNLGLHGQLDVGERGLRPAVRSDAGQNPAAALLVHQPARAVYRVNDDAPQGVFLRRPARQHDPAQRQALADEDERRTACHLALEQLDEQLLAHAVNGVDRVAPLLARDTRERLDRRALARLDHRRAYQLVQAQQRREQRPHIVPRERLRHHRSEERRVGKEGRSRWSPYH